MSLQTIFDFYMPNNQTRFYCVAKQDCLIYLMSIDIVEAVAGRRDKYFGPTIDLHKTFIISIWGPGANVAIFLVLYAYRKQWVWLHGLLLIIGSIFTIATAIPIVVQTGIIDENSTNIDTGDRSKNLVNKHYILGLVSLGFITLAMLLGMGLKAINIWQRNTKWILTLKRIHQICGYITVIICKANMYLFADDDLPLLVADDIIFAVLLIIRKLLFPKMEGSLISPKYDSTDILKVTSIKDLDPSGSYVVFANYIYSTENLKTNHPAGYQIIKAVENREVDRFIYGTCPVEELPDVPLWSHSFRSFKLLGQPLARIQIPQTFSGFEEQQAQCKIKQLRLYSQRGNIYQLSLAKKKGSPFQWLKYRDVSQLGRYYSVTINDKVTRLYTNVNFLVEENKKLLSKYLKWTQRGVNKNQHLYLSQGEQNPSEPPVSVHTPLNPHEVYKAEDYSNKSSDSATIPLMIKAYAKGQFTQHITDKPIEKIVVSCSKGEGLQLARTQPGRIIIVAGGTGLFPFSDLIDLLYKEQLIHQDNGRRQQILKVSPVLRDNPFRQFTFTILLAINHAEDIHAITYEQLVYLSQRKRMDVILKLKSIHSEYLRWFKTTELRFQEELLKQMESCSELSKVWVCGPPKMNQQIVGLLKQKQLKLDFYLIV